MKSSIFDAEKLKERRKEHKVQPFRIKQIFHEIFKNAVMDFQEMTALSKDLRQSLEDNFTIVPFKLKEMQESDDTTKFLFELPDGNVIEQSELPGYTKYTPY